MNASPQSEVEIERLVTWLVGAFEAENATTLSTFAVERVREAASAVHEVWLLRRTDTQRVEVNQLALGKHLEKTLSAGHLAAIFDGTEAELSDADRARFAAASDAEERVERSSLNDARVRWWARLVLFAFAGAIVASVIWAIAHLEHGREHGHDKRELRR